MMTIKDQMSSYVDEEIRLYKAKRAKAKAEELEDRYEELNYEEDELFFDEFADEEDFEEEEEQMIDDDQILEDMFETLERTFNLDVIDINKLVKYIRNLEYDYKAVVNNFKKGIFGPVIRINKVNPQKKAKDLKKDFERSREAAYIRSQSNPLKKTPEEVRAFISSSKPFLNLVIVGHVDAGKSTTIGHLLYICGAVQDSEMSKIQREIHQSRSKDERYAWVMARSASEREHGVTIDVSERDFETEKLYIKVLDAPGHRDYVPDMIKGAAAADAALLIVDVTKPMVSSGQCTEHIVICRSLDIKQYVVAINKMDRAGFSEQRFNDVKNEVMSFLQSLGITEAQFIPTVSTLGDGLKQHSENFEWYKGPSLYEAIDSLTPPMRNISGEFQMAIFESFSRRNKQIEVSGRISSGYVSENDTVQTGPIEELATVVSIEVNGNPVKIACAGQMPTLILKTSHTTESLTVGCELISLKTRHVFGTRFTAIVNTFEMESVLSKGSQAYFHRDAISIPITVQSVDYWLDRTNMNPTKKNPQFLPSNSSAVVTLELSSPLSLVPSKHDKLLSRFILRFGGKTIGFGTILKPLE